MYLEIILPSSFLVDINMQNEKSKNIFLQASNLEDLYKQFQDNYPTLVSHIWNDDGSIKKNIMLVVNDNLINKSEYDILKFPNHTILEIMTQFAGG